MTSLQENRFVGSGEWHPDGDQSRQGGYKLVAYDTDVKRTRRSNQRWKSKLRQPGRVGSMCGTVITMRPTARSCAKRCSAATASKIARRESQPGALLIDMSSSSPVGTRELARCWKSAASNSSTRRLEWLQGRDRRTLAIMVGGMRQVRADEPLCRESRQPDISAGPLGSGHAIKRSTIMCQLGTRRPCEAVVAGKRFGLDPGVSSTSSMRERHEQHNQKQIQAAHAVGHLRRGFFTGTEARTCAPRWKS